VNEPCTEGSLFHRRRLANTGTIARASSSPCATRASRCSIWSGSPVSFRRTARSSPRAAACRNCRPARSSMSCWRGVHKRALAAGGRGRRPGPFPAKGEQYGYISEHHDYGIIEPKMRDLVEDNGRHDVATRWASSSTRETAYDKRKEIYHSRARSSTPAPPSKPPKATKTASGPPWSPRPCSCAT